MTTLAAVDRVVHHAVILDMGSVPSYRAQQAQEQQRQALEAVGQCRRQYPDCHFCGGTMQAVISVLDESHCQQVIHLWEELKREFSICGTLEHVPFPHFTYQGAISYDGTRLRAALEQVARETDPFEVETDGVGIFTGPSPVLYLPVVRSPVLTRIHQQVWQALQPIGVGITPIYGPEHWIPHITLAQGDLTPAHLSALMRALSPRTFSWRITIANLTVIETTSDTPDAAYTIATQITLKREEQEREV
jgi:2'-5' RNA ligase